MKFDKRKLLQLILTITAISFSGFLPAAAQSWPDKTIRIIVPFAAGGGVDNITRVISPHLSARLKQPVIIENRPGANANLGSDIAAKAPADGYTLLMGATHLAFNRATMKDLPFDSAKDFVPVARTGRAPFILVVPASLPIKNVSELVTYMKANPNQASYGTVGAGAPTNLIFVKQTGTSPVQVLYKGGSAAMPDLIAGRLTYMIQTASEVLPLIASGKLRALAVSGKSRASALPDVPTMTEAGVSNLELTGWWGVFAPAKTPASVVNRLSAEIQAVMKQPEVVMALTKLGVESAPMPAEEFSQFFKKEASAYVDIAREFNLNVE